MALATVIGWAVPAFSQEIHINEILAANNTISPDNVDFDDYSDWIELHNNTASPVDLSSYFLTDDLGQPLKWRISAGAFIAANGYFIVRADGFDAVPGQVYTREFAPWDTFQTRRFHASFKLGSSGEVIGLYRISSPIQSNSLLPLGSVWKYLDKGTAPGEGWADPDFDDHAWLSGAAELGYGEGDEATVVSYGPSSSKKYPATYFRTSFNVTNPANLAGVRCRALVDDGAVVYLNGIEIVRLRMPAGDIDYLSFASASASEDDFDTIVISSDQLRAGNNVLAVEVHQRTAGSSDLGFDIELIVDEVNGSPTLIDSVSFGAQVDDVSYGRIQFPGTTSVAIASGSTWKYRDTGADPGENWAGPDFDDSAWSSGVAKLGYGDDDEQTTLDYGPSGNNKYPATYFRSTFNVIDPAQLESVECRAIIDDGAVFYLNGTEIRRIRMPSGAVDHLTFAGASAPEDGFEPFAVDAGQIRAGVNVLAVEVHQRTADSSDLGFDLEVTLRQKAEEGGGWAYFGEPTPENANTTIATLERTPSTDVIASVASGFYPGSRNIALSTSSGNAEIRYTLDGSVPKSASLLYTAAIPVDSTTVLRARTFEVGRIPGSLATYSYFINEPARPLPVVSFVVDPDVFFDSTIGIYENVHKGREAPSHIEYFAADQSLGFKVNCGTKIGGENIWRFAQKPLNVSMRGKYGDDLISYRIFPDEKIGTFDSIKFRNGGDNWNDAMLRDPLAPSIVRGQMQSDVAAYRPCVLYLNGRYWGIHNLRETLGDQYFFNRHHINSGEYDLLKFEHTINGTELVADEGTADAYLAFEALATGNDLSVQSNYDAVVARMNLESFLDYIMMVDFVGESSWHHNQEYWSERKPGAKWHWTINDIDRGFSSSRTTDSLIDDLIDRHPLFEALVENISFTNLFAQRYAAHLGSTFHPERISDLLDELSGEVDPEMPRHIDRWEDEDGISSLSSRQDELDEIKQFAEERAGNVYSDMAEHLDLASGTAELTVNILPVNAGRVLVNGVPMLPRYSNVARLYENIAFEMMAESAPGYEFTGWSSGEPDPAISLTLSAGSIITANFQLSGESIIPSVVNTDTLLSATASPYTSGGDIVINAGSTLTIKEGVVIRLPEAADIHVKGALRIEGSGANPVLIESRDGLHPWGGLTFVNATGASMLSHVWIKDASFADDDPVNLKAAVSSINSNLVIDHADIDAPFPVFARGGTTTVRFSRIHPRFTGDGVNIKSGNGIVEDCTFLGNDAPDTDAIDFDDVSNGIIRRNRIYSFRGTNSDGIDVGEASSNLLITGNRIYDCSDKGVSVGQGSTVSMRRNLIVRCSQGVGVKDSGSSAIIDQNTFARNLTGVAVFEKNAGNGGGEVMVTNCIFSRSKDFNATVDGFSSLVVNYSLSDTILIPGTGNFVADPLFTDAAAYDFSIRPGSPAIDTGDPGHVPDSDQSRADIGAYYTYDPDDYPFQVPNVVVVNEILAHSDGGDPDWIELYNTSSSPADISGWYLSDSAPDLQKYQIASGTVIPANGYVVFYEDQHFGAVSTDPGRITPFALSENGETVYLFGPGDGLLLGYHEEESFGPSATGISKGRYFKPASNTYNFVAMAMPTPGAYNGKPFVGPIVISEIMYHPDTGDAEYLELLNISAVPVILHDAAKDEAWRVTSGVTFSFPVNPPVTMQPGERILLVRNTPVFASAFNVPAAVQVFQWTAGGLSNSGEQIEISSPGDLDEEGIRQFIRVERVGYEDRDPWPAAADLGLLSLTRIDVGAYGNEADNWHAAIPSPGQSSFEKWAAESGLPPSAAGPGDDPDQDGRSNLIEYGTGTSPLAGDPGRAVKLQVSADGVQVAFEIAADRPGLSYRIERSPDVKRGNWESIQADFIPGDGITRMLTGADPAGFGLMFYRMVITD
jgi:hypothetical protein